MATISGVLARQARRVPTRDALVFGERRMSYAEADAEVNRRANALADAGLKKGDRLAIMSTNSDDFVLVIYAAFRLGAILVPVNPRMAAPEVTYLLDDSGATAFVFAPALAEVAGNAHAAAAAPPAIMLATNAGSAHDDIASLAAAQSTQAPAVEVVETDDAEILYTSGTTGRPKGVLLDHHRVLWVGINVNLGCGICDGDRILHVAPFYHSAELNLFLIGGMLVGATHVILPAFEPTAVLQAMASEEINVFFGVPTMYQMLLADPAFNSHDLSQWRVGMFGAAPMPQSTIEQLAQAVPDARLFNLCGPTEAGPGGISLGPADMQRKPGSNGVAFVNTEARVVDADGRDAAAGQIGEIVLRGETLMKGYWNRPEATDEAMRDGWLHTGDLARIDADGYMTLVDRMKDMIITGGMNVYSAEIENALAAHPDVLDCAVVGVPHELYGESIVAIVTPRTGVELDLETVRAHVGTLLADYKAPHRLEIGEVPRNPSGKIVKHGLRAALSEG
jgi:acyl-CoA synthetase (AMP-forming)/AMP-acid ligase II